MIGQFHELLRTTPDEGASAAIGTSAPHPFEETDQLLEAWCRERQERVETELFLEEASRLLEKILHESFVSPTFQRKARRLLRAIEAAHLSSCDD